MARAFQAPDIPEEPKAQARAVSEAFIVIAAELASFRALLAEPPKTRALDTSGTTILPAVGDTLRLKPPAAGTKVTLPASNAANKNQTVTIIVEGTAGNVVVSAIAGLVQFGASVTLIGRGSRTFVSDGGDGGAVGGWWLAPNDLVPAMPATAGWPAVLANDNNSGAFNPHIDASQFIGFGVEGSLPATGQIRSSAAFLARSSAALDLRSGTTMTLDTGTAFSVLANTIGLTTFTGAIAATAATSVTYTANAGDVALSASDQIQFTTNATLRFTIEPTGAWDLAGLEGVAAQVLTSNGPGVPPTWQAGGGGGGALTLLTTEVNLGTGPTLSGTFTIAGAGMTIGKPVLIQQAAGPYTGKGTLVDECEDMCTVTAIVTSTTVITAHWEAVKTPLAGNVKFDYAVSA